MALGNCAKKGLDMLTVLCYNPSITLLRRKPMEDLISKKEVLEKYGISYGALYLSLIHI